MNREEIFTLADSLYWSIIDQLDLREKLVIKDPDNLGGTKNTEEGSDLYYCIEDTIKDYFKTTEENE
jgi:hypothetical protein